MLEQQLERIAVALETIAAVVGTPVLEAQPDPKKRGRPAKEPAPEVDPLGDAPVVVTQDEVHAALRKYMDKNGIEKTKAIMIKLSLITTRPFN